MAKLGPWQVLDGHSIGRVEVGAHPDRIRHRYAFIEKTPRVRIRDACSNTNPRWIGDYLNWAAGPYKLGQNEESKKWCDAMLRLLGHELEDDTSNITDAAQQENL